MNKYLIFRTDRIGDFLLSAILIKCIKRNDKNAFIIVVCSKKNFDYIKNFRFIDKVYKFENNIFNRFVLIKNLRKHNFKTVIIHDGKKRSRFINFFLNKDKFLSVDNNDIIDSHITKIKNIIKLLKFNFDDTDLNFLNIKNYDESQIVDKNTIHLHYDEKWSNNTYISKYTDIEPSENQLLEFIHELKVKSNFKVVVTTGLNTPDVLKNIISKINDDKIKIIQNISFIELENVVFNSKLLISCHGAISHVASAYNVKQIDIIDTNKQNPYTNWTDHFRNYNFVYRKNFIELKSDIFKYL